MTSVVVDASVVVIWYIPERDHKQARALRDAYLDGRHELLGPELLPFEVINALKYSDYFDGEQLVQAATTLPEYGISLVPYRRSGPVADIAATLDITIYDASYLALAQMNNTTVYTADPRLLDVISGSDYASLGTHIRSYDDSAR